jgi:hypothetical protein
MHGETRMQMARSIGVAVLAGVLAAGCGGGGAGDSDSRATEQESANSKPGSTGSTGASKDGAAGTASVKSTAADPRLASAVADTKTTAPVDLLYDIPVKPEVGQPFTVELAAKPRLPADALDIEVADSPGLTIQGERMARFPAVESGQPYTMKVQVVGNTAGLYYVSVMAKLSTKVQSEARAFSVPVVIGTPAAVQKPAPQRDASGQAIESLPAKEQ